jgi:hypothetical protein
MTHTDSSSRADSRRSSTGFLLTPAALAREAERLRFIARRCACFNDMRDSRLALTRARHYDRLALIQERPA